ncbi:membrane-bound ClpP family serine protease [Streptomyces umbrinus]|uniref:hypothetical protein n=1 Tax=Streptomyces umbrinus TaxID=67370 RepID=UPI00167EA9FC|nr:hypothetical protein [Streptomyces umbrinus]MCR3725111.1 membrane-bound ClpP family serine protease [Streptomyces umbrinus]GHH62866.1 hypothetical protein GCM10018775_79710 [Streptomyces umbrinus]
MNRNFERGVLREAFSIFGPLLGIATVAGPILGGFLVDAAGWRFMFPIDIALSIAAFVAAVRVLPTGQGERSTVIDVRGSGLLALTMLAWIFGLIEGSTDGRGALAITSLAVGTPAFALLCRRQTSAADPLRRASLLKNRGFTSGLAMGLGYFASPWSADRCTSSRCSCGRAWAVRRRRSHCRSPRSPSASSSRPSSSAPSCPSSAAT